MGAEVIILANPYTYNFLKGLTHSAMQWTGLVWHYANAKSNLSIR